ncbi:MAG: aminotransferase class III-fold pyridoxal phosphate-dependent enzyme [Pseudomonadota bacterium]
MTTDFPGPKTLAALKRGVPLFKNGRRFEQEMAKASTRGSRSACQIVVDRAAGDFIWDMDGKRYIDFQNGWATNPLGNAHPEIIAAVHAAHQRYGFHFDHPLRYELAESLAGIMPQQALPRFSFEVSGTEAAEAAMHAAMTYTQRRYVIIFSSSYHGNGLATKVASGSAEGKRYLDAWQGGVIVAPYPYSSDLPPNLTQEQYVDYCLWHLDQHIPEAVVPRDEIAAVMVEPGLAEGGNWIPTKSFFGGIREVCDKNGWLMIADEVLTGLGRTGRMWAVEHYDVVPDILIVGKNLSGGIEPCAGIATRDEILGDNSAFSTGSTFAGTPAGCAAGLKTLELYGDLNIVQNAARLGELALNIMKQWTRYSIVKEVRCNGLLMGVAFHSSANDHEDWWCARSVRSLMLRNGVWAINDRESTIRLYPALNMADEVLLEGLDVMEKAIAQVDEHGHNERGAAAWPTGVAGF